MVGSRKNRHKYKRWVEGANANAYYAPPRWESGFCGESGVRAVEDGEDGLLGSLWGQGNGHDGEADEEGVAEMEGGHGGEFVGEAIVGPD